ncbi:tigger transposable element-derived protein 6-like protein [Plakobranchus ocellatus]|uniref:Tigger transposable element-derived protein 6-like protein n=1 Tax=Plakobranchus ocellatus TaxID=259542 RepID=A0AAV4BAG4_9GAST|nr:tigger transposable element-derived protein 6-like protein [Plakobranchus ocellatus]
MAPRRLQYSEEAMTAACTSVSKGTGLREAARLHGVPYPTLRARINGRKSIRKMERTVLGVERETQLTDWLEESARRGFGRTKKQLLSTVQNCLNQKKETTPFKDNKPGEKWYRLFWQRNKEKLALRTPQDLGSQRAAVSEAKIRNWFAKAKEDILAVDPSLLGCPDRIFKCDESGFQLGGGVKRKVLAAKVDKHVYQVSNDIHQQVTVLVCGNAAGELQAPLLIFPGQRFFYDPMEGFPEAHFAKSGNGWIDSEIFAKWLSTGFVPAVAHLQKPVLLFADGHSTHLTLAIHEICKEHNIILYQLPSHSSHIVQPLDLTSFKNLKQAWGEEVMKFKEENSDTLTKQNFSKVFRKAWDRRGHDGDVPKNGFKASGVVWYNYESGSHVKI